MNKQYKTVIQTYFSDYVKWLLLVSFLFVVSLMASIAFNGASEFLWVIPVSFIVIYFLSIPLFILYGKVRKDIKDNNIDQITIRTFTINHDKNFNFKNRGGTTIGKTKYRIIDENNNLYLVSTSNDNELFMCFHPNFSLEVIVLKKSRLVLQMRIIENTQTFKEAREQNHNIKHFKKIFNHYL